MPTLRDLREEAVLTREELAAKCGVSPQAIYYWERGESIPRPRHIRKLAEVFNKSLAEIRQAIQDTAAQKERPAA